MGLDMYAYSVSKEFVSNVDTDFTIQENSDRAEFFYWRKHPDLHQWMHRLYLEKGGDPESEFNISTVKLNEGDIMRLRIELGSLPTNQGGFFFGESTPDNFANDVEFCRKALSLLEAGQVVYYTSWW